MAFAAIAGLAIAPDRIGETVRGGVVQHAGWPLEAAFTAALMLSAFIVFRTFDALFRTAGARALQCHPVPGASIVRDRLLVVAADTLRASLVLSAFVVPCLFRPGGELAVYALVFALAAPWLTAMVGFGVLANAGAVTADPEAAPARALDGFGEISGGVWHIAPGAAYAASAIALLAFRLGCGELAAGDGEILNSAKVALFAPTLAAMVALVSGARLWARHAHRISARFFDAEVATADDRWVESGEDALASAGRDPSDVLAAAAGIQLGRRHPVLLASAWGASILVTAILWATGGALSPPGVAVGLVAWFALGIAPGRRARTLDGVGPFGAAPQLASMRVVAEARQRAAGAAAARLAPALLAPVVATGAGAVAWLGCAIPGAVALGVYTSAGLDRRYAAVPIVAAAIPALVSVIVGPSLVAWSVAGVAATLAAIALARYVHDTVAGTTP